jgi:hypothetical protein
MKFMLVMQGTRAGWESMGTWKPEEIRAHITFMIELYKELSKAGELVMAEGLDMPVNAKIVKATRADAPVISDGPFPESKEFLAGFWIVDVKDAKRAYAIAAKASTAPGQGGKPMAIPIEVRQVMSTPSVEP